MAKYRFDEIAINCTEKKIPDEADKLNYIGLEHLDPGCIHVSRWGSNVPLKGEKLVMHKGDVLFGKRNAYLRRAAISPHDGLFSAHGMVLRPQTNVIDPDFFPLFIASDYFFDEAIRISVGSLSPTVNWKDLRKLEFELPGMEEQQKLVKLLWKIVNTQEAYQNLIDATDELVESQFIEMFGDPSSNSMNWDKWPLGEKCKIITGNTPPRADVDNYGDFIEWIKSDNINESNIYVTVAKEKLSEKGFAICRYVDNDCLLMTCIAGSTNSIGNVAVTNRRVAFNQQINAIVPIDDEVMYLYWLMRLSKPLIQNTMNKSLKGILSKSQLSKMEFPFPPVKLQAQFTNFVIQANKSKLELEKTMQDLDVTYKLILEENLG